MSGYLIELRSDVGAIEVSVVVPVNTEARNAALQLALAVMTTLRHHPRSNGHTLTLKALV